MQREVSGVTQTLTTDGTDGVVSRRVAYAFDEFAKALEQAKIESDSPEARFGAEAAMRETIAAARSWAAEFRNSSQS